MKITVIPPAGEKERRELEIKKAAVHADAAFWHMESLALSRDNARKLVALILKKTRSDSFPPGLHERERGGD